MQFSVTLRTNRAGAIKSLMDTGGNGTAEVRTGSAPGVGNTASGTLLATLTNVTITNNSDGTLSYTFTADSSVDASGTPGHVRFKNGAGTAVKEVTSGLSSTEFNWNQALALGGNASASGTLTEGNQ